MNKQGVRRALNGHYDLVKMQAAILLDDALGKFPFSEEVTPKRVVELTDQLIQLEDQAEEIGYRCCARDIAHCREGVILLNPEEEEVYAVCIADKTGKITTWQTNH